MRWARSSVLVGLVASLLATVVACSSSAAPDSQPARLCRGSWCVDPAGLVGSLRDHLDGRVTGYVALVGDTVISGGMARRETDSPALPMGPEVMANTASVGKVFTTVVVLKALARQGVGVDTPIASYLPAGWVRGPGVELVTFRDLLTHRSGFRMDSARVFTDESAAREQISQGISAADHGRTAYNNINFTVVRDLLPQIEQAGGSADALFLERVQRDVFDPVDVRTAACTRPVQPMLFYPPADAPAGAAAPVTPAATARVAGQVPPVGPSACSSGGWFITPADILQIMRGLADGTLLDADLQEEMHSGCLGWDACGLDGSRAKAGAFGDLVTGAFETYAGIGTGLPFVVVTNSPVGQSGLGAVVRLAQASATTPR